MQELSLCSSWSCLQLHMLAPTTSPGPPMESLQPPSLALRSVSSPCKASKYEPMEIFHHKVLRGCLKLSQSSPKPALFFILGELPIEGRLHMNTLSLFHNIWDVQTPLLNR